MPEASVDALVGRTVAGRFKVTRAIGRGGMGAVYEVERGEERAALKIIARDVKSSDPRALKRFEREARLASEIDHPNVTRTLEFGADPELQSPFLLMELLSGDDLGVVIEERAPLTPAIAARIAIQAARGLAAAHGHGVIHRDVKPQNLFLHRSGAGLTVKVCDFGIAKLGESSREDDASSLTNSGGIIGSPRYMSPEQARGTDDVDGRTDVWSLCASLYEVLSGQRLWSAETLGELIVAICTNPIPRLSATAPWFHEGWPTSSTAASRGTARTDGRAWPSWRLRSCPLPQTAF